MSFFVFVLFCFILFHFVFVENIMVQWFNGLFHPIITKSYNNKCNINHIREQMLDEDPAKREAKSAESSALRGDNCMLLAHRP